MPVADIHSEAETELANAVSWYERQREGLGDRFLDEYDRTLSLIEESPMCGSPTRLYQWRDQQVRRVSTRILPYHLVYMHDSQRLLLIAVAHHRRIPVYSLNRLP